MQKWRFIIIILCLPGARINCLAQTDSIQHRRPILTSTPYLDTKETLPAKTIKPIPDLHFAPNYCFPAERSSYLPDSQLKKRATNIVNAELNSLPKPKH